MKTVKEIADELKLPKQRVYRYIKRECISEADQRNGVMYYDEAAEAIIKQALIENTASADAHHDTDVDVVSDSATAMVMVNAKYLSHIEAEVEFLRSELSKTREALQTGQALHAGTIKKQLQSGEEGKPDYSENLSFFSRIFRKRDKQ